MRWIGMLLATVCACTLFGAEPSKECLGAIETAVSQTAAGHWTESERELAGIIAQSRGGNLLCLGIASADLAVLLQRRGEARGAERYALQSVAALEAGGAEYQVALARPLQVLAEAYLAEHRFGKAKDVMARLELLPGSSARDRAVRAGAHGLIDADEGRWHDAERHYRAAIAEWEAAGEGDRMSIVPELTNLGLMYLTNRRLADAAPAFERARHITENSKDATDEQRLTIMTNLGVLYAKQGRWQAADGLLRQALEIADGGAGIPSISRRRLYESYALVLRRIGQKREARALEAKADTLLPPDASSMTVDVGELAARHH